MVLEAEFENWVRVLSSQQKLARTALHWDVGALGFSV